MKRGSDALQGVIDVASSCGEACEGWSGGEGKLEGRSAVGWKLRRLRCCRQEQGEVQQKIRAKASLCNTLLPPPSIPIAFTCGPERFCGS